jgi:acetolactate synthase-1/2/3 large subunit
MPDDTIIVDDGVSSTLMLRENTEGAAPYDLLPAATGGQIGSGVAIGAGAAVACPDHKVIVLSGDYTRMQDNSALWNLATENLNVLVINYNNKGSTTLEMEMSRVPRGEAQPKSLKMVHITKPEIDYAGMAETMGVPATKATTAEEFYDQFEAAMANNGPNFIDAEIVRILPMLRQMVRPDMFGTG